MSDCYGPGDECTPRQEPIRYAIQDRNGSEPVEYVLASDYDAVLARVQELERHAELADALCAILQAYAGETGESEGAVDVLHRKLQQLAAMTAERDEAQWAKNQCVIYLYHKLDKLDDRCNKLQEERDSLKASCHTFEQQLTEAHATVAKYQRGLQDAARELLVPFPEPDTLTAKLVQANRLLRAERSHAEQQVARLREACGNKLEVLRGIVEVDETYVGGIEGNKHESKKRKQGRGAVGKAAVLGMRERGGRTVAMPISDVDKLNLHTKVYAHIEPGTTLYTDEHGGYHALRGLFFGHETVNHSAKEYVRGAVSTNSIESVWAVLKRGIQGVYHHASEKHLKRYVDEFTFRLNDGNVQRHTLERLDSFVTATANRRLTYKELTA